MGNSELFRRPADAAHPLVKLSGRWLAEIDRTAIPCYHVASEDDAMIMFAVPAPSSPKSIPFSGFG